MLPSHFFAITRVLLSVLEYEVPGLHRKEFGPPYAITKDDVDELYGPYGCSVQELERIVDDDPSPKILKNGAHEVMSVVYLVSKNGDRGFLSKDEL